MNSENIPRTRTLGVALATGELGVAGLDGIDARVCTDLRLGSSVASASAGIELMHGEVFVLGNSGRSRSALRAACGVMRDAIDLPAVLQVVAEAGLAAMRADPHHEMLDALTRQSVFHALEEEPSGVPPARNAGGTRQIA